jgi:hypothetical protein
MPLILRLVQVIFGLRHVIWVTCDKSLHATICWRELRYSVPSFIHSVDKQDLVAT